MRLGLVFVLVAALAGCSVVSKSDRAQTDAAESTPEAAALPPTKRGPSAELSAKRGIVDREDSDGAIRELTERTIVVGTATGGSVAVSGFAVDADGAVAVESSSGALYRVELRESSGLESASRLPMSTRLLFPFSVRRRSGALWVAHNQGLTLLDSSGVANAKVPILFSIVDFVPVASAAFALNPRSLDGLLPTIVTVDTRGARLREWTDEGSLNRVHGDLAGIAGESSLAACGQRLIVGMRHARTVHVLSPRLEKISELQIPFPGHDKLDALAERRDLTRPNPATFWLPTFLGGVACTEASIFVLLDLPVATVLEFDLSGRLRSRFRSNSGRWRRFTALEAAPDGRLFALGIDEQLNSHIVELQLSQVKRSLVDRGR